ncbi:MAG: hypothetical protein HC808_17550 [Candidatus Competibacteraceae bacterium]|nr:hypothetical protein [Candidatus Competibacteraceae bacterium]
MYAQLFLGLLIWFALGLAVALVFAAVAANQDAEQINPAIPPGAAFVRVSNVTAPGNSLLVRMANFDFGNLSYKDISLYRQVCEGKRFFQIGDKQQQLTIAAGNYYTLTVLGQDEDQQVFLVKDAISGSSTDSQPVAERHASNRSIDHDIDLDDYFDHGRGGVA